MNEQNDFEKQVEQEERAYSEPEQAEFQQAEGETSGSVSDLIDKIKELVNKGNVTKIVIKKGDNVLVNIPLNVGIVGGIIGVAAAPWAIVAAAVATAGFACKVELVKNDGEVVRVASKEFGEKAKDVTDAVKDMGAAVKDMGAAVVEGIKDAVKADDPDIEVEIEHEGPAEEPEVINIPVEDAPTEE